MWELILKGVVGSKAYGMDTPASDTDVKGVCFGPVKHYLGLEHFEQVVSTCPDKTIYELRKFVKLALNANPSIIELLFLEEYEYCSELGKRLLNVRKEFLSQRARASFCGYAYQQIQKCRRKVYYEDCNAGIAAKDPYKHAAHCLRLIRMGEEILTTGEVIVNRSGIDADELKEIRFGRSLLGIEQVLAMAEGSLSKLQAVETKLPEHPNYDKVEEVLKGMLWDYLFYNHLNEIQPSDSGRKSSS